MKTNKVAVAGILLFVVAAFALGVSLYRKHVHSAQDQTVSAEQTRLVRMHSPILGPQGAPVTACAAGVQAIGDAARLIRSGEADIALCGGAEAAMHRVSLGGFAAAKALSTSFNDTPQAASRPFDEQRDGFVMSEGAGLLVIERLELAENHRDLALFNMAIDSKLRGCDLVRMKVVNVMASGQIKERASVLQSKTQKPVRFEISEGTRASVAKRLAMMVSGFFSPPRVFISSCTRFMKRWKCVRDFSLNGSASKKVSTR